MTELKQTLAILGGTGKEGSGLACRLAHVGYPVVIGSRSSAKAEAMAQELSKLIGSTMLRGADNHRAATEADIVVLAVPFSAQCATAREVGPLLSGKILIDVTVPLVPPTVGRVQLPNGQSAVLALQELLGPDVRVVSAFQNVSAHHLMALSHPVDCDVLVCGDDKDACDTVIHIAADAGMRAFYAGVLANSAAAEALTSVLITINRHYKVPSAGIRLTGIGAPNSTVV
jgi:NADPH-dependent F420 reductase